MTIFRCLRCGYSWVPRTPAAPARCARCKARYFDRPARIPKPTSPPARRRPGAVARFPQLHEIATGQSALLPWYVKPDGMPDFIKSRSIAPAVYYHARTHGKRFKLTPKPSGLQVTRLA